MEIDINKIIASAKDIGTKDIVENDISKEILRVARLVYETNVDMNPWFRGVDMIEKLRHLGKSNVRNHLEKLAEKDMLEAKLHGTKKVYRIRVIKEDG